MLVFSLGILTAFFSELVTAYYHLTRRTDRPVRREDRGKIMKTLLCAGLNILIFVLSGAVRNGEIRWFFLLLAVIADVDILIRKIPTELLIFIGLYTLTRAIPLREHLPGILSGAAVGTAFLLARTKTKTGLYDTLLTACLASLYNAVIPALQFAALTLILWGITGLILKMNKKRGELMPLAPVIIAAWVLIFRLGFL